MHLFMVLMPYEDEPSITGSSACAAFEQHCHANNAPFHSIRRPT